MSEEFSSIGHLGSPEHRSDERLYLNAGRYMPDAASVAQEWEDLATRATTDPETTSRLVLRGIVSDAALEELRQGPYADLLEAALPLGEELGRPNNNLIYLGQNAPGREPIDRIEDIVAATSEPNPVKKMPVDRVQEALQTGTVIKTTISPEDHDGLYELWGGTFGWDRDKDQVAVHARRLEESRTRASSAREVWFSGVEKDGRLVAAATAERLTLPGSDGPIDLVESTEWSVRKDAGKNGYGATALAALNAQILHDFEGSPYGRPVIFAECNFKTRADRLGNSVGMAIPPREHANQVLRQNVEVTDGKEPPGLRDFNLMHLPLSAQQQYYRPEDNARIVSMINSEVRA